VKDLAGKVAVVTGAASGMGLAFAQRFADEGMNVVLADIESEPLALAHASIEQRGVKALAVRTNVMLEADIQRLADQAFATFGNVHVLCNNAGVASGGAAHSWERPLSDWEWVFGVDFMGVLHGIRAFLPRMLENGEEGHIVNTASLAGLLPSFDPYSVAKHGVVAITEGLYNELRMMGAKVSVSVLCPGWINTNIIESSMRNRPPEYGAAALDESAMTAEAKQGLEMVRGFLRNGIAPEEVAGRVCTAIVEQQLYIIPAQDYFFDILRARYDNIVNQRNPAPGPGLSALQEQQTASS
jgi:NAD(P)-dependent dehydrogenase (short-subunit alcohol dehydrogenase family)